MESFLWAGTLVVALVATYTDLRHGKIYDWLTYSALGIGLVLQAFWGAGIPLALLGTIVGFSLFFVPFFMGWMGWGDVKLLAALGAFVGNPQEIVLVFLCSIIIGGITGLIVTFHRLQQSFDGEIDPSIPFAPSIMLGLILTTVIRVVP